MELFLEVEQKEVDLVVDQKLIQDQLVKMHKEMLVDLQFQKEMLGEEELLQVMRLYLLEVELAVVLLAKVRYVARNIARALLVVIKLQVEDQGRLKLLIL